MGLQQKSETPRLKQEEGHKSQHVNVTITKKESVECGGEPKPKRSTIINAKARLVLRY